MDGQAHGFWLNFFLWTHIKLGGCWDKLEKLSDTAIDVYRATRFHADGVIEVTSSKPPDHKTNSLEQSFMRQFELAGSFSTIKSEILVYEA